MDYALYIAASGALTSMYRQDVLSNNLANMDTAGFKPDLAAAKQRLDARHEDHLDALPSNALLERLGAGVMLAPNRVSFTQGSLRPTSNPYDLAIQGGGFFVVRDQTDATGDRVSLTRDGRFYRDREGTLVNGSGLPVLDPQNRPITIPEGEEVRIASEGTITQGGAVVGRVQVVDVPDASALRKRGHGLFTAPASALANARGASGAVRQFNVEESTVDSVTTIMDITGAARDVEANLGVIQASDRLSDRAINTFGRVA